MNLEELKRLYLEASEINWICFEKDFEYSKKTGKNSFYLTKEAKELRSKRKEALRKMYQAYDEYEKENHLLYEEQDWISNSKFHTFSDTMEGARKDFCDKASKLNGVTIRFNEKGIKVIEVKTRNKIYSYQVHAYYTEKSGCYGACIYNETYNNGININERNKLGELDKLFAKH